MSETPDLVWSRKGNIFKVHSSCPCGETWVDYYTTEMKESSIEWLPKIGYAPVKEIVKFVRNWLLYIPKLSMKEEFKLPVQ